MQRFLKWLGTLVFGEAPKPATPNSRIMNDHLRATQIQKRVSKNSLQAHDRALEARRRETGTVAHCTGRIETAGPGKNVLIGFEDEVSVPEGLSIEEFDGGESGDGVAFDPYNTGRFDRSASWSKILRK